MKRTLLALGLIGCFLASAHYAIAGYYPEETEALCANVKHEEATEQLKTAYECVNAKNEYLRKQLEEAYKKAYSDATDKEKIERSWNFEAQAQKDYTNNVVDVVAKDGVTKELYDDAVDRNIMLILAVNRYSIMPLPKNIRKSKTPVKLMDSNFNKALAKTKDKTALRNAQKKWDADSKEICNDTWGWNEYFGDQAKTASKNCINDLARVRCQELAEMAKAKTTTTKSKSKSK